MANSMGTPISQPPWQLPLQERQHLARIWGEPIPEDPQTPEMISEEGDPKTRNRIHTTITMPTEEEPEGAGLVGL